MGNIVSGISERRHDLVVLFSSLFSVIGAGMLAKETESAPDSGYSDDQKVQYGALRSCAIILLTVNILCMLLMIVDRFSPIIAHDLGREYTKMAMYLIYYITLIVVLSVAVNSIRLMDGKVSKPVVGLISTGLAVSLVGLILTGYEAYSKYSAGKKEVQAARSDVAGLGI